VPSSATSLTAETLSVGGEYDVHFWQYVPPRSDVKLPALIFLHGRGERARAAGAEELDRVLKHGPPKLLAADVGLGFLLLAPQAPPGCEWRGASLVPIVDAMIDRALELGADPGRVYLTGLSMGAHGAWRFAAARGERLAAIVPIAGAAPARAGCAIARAGVAVWAFHGADDEIVDPAGSIRGVEAVNACTRPRPKEPALLTIYPGVGHGSWIRTYDPESRFDPKSGRPSAEGINIYEWLLRHRRG
jgi:predicted peptidase